MTKAKMTPGGKRAYAAVSAILSDALNQKAMGLPGWEYIKVLDELVADLECRSAAMKEELASDD